MKTKFIPLWLLICIIGFASCSKKNEISNMNEIQIDQNVISQVIASKDVEEQKIMYKTLNSSEKSYTWQVKYEKILATSDLTKEQIKFINKLKSNLSKEIFEKGINPIKNKFQAYELTLKNEAIELFGISGAYELLATLSLNRAEQIPPGQGDCDCSKTSDWCPSGHSCLRVGCVIITNDCGTFWNYDCNGDCWIGSA